jgi:hypothetical protein
MLIFNFLRFRQRPPGKTPPPNDRVDVFYDAATGKITARDSQDAAVLFDGAGGASSTADLTTSNGTAAAAAGRLGEYLEDEGEVSGISNYVSETVASVVLSPGDWDVHGFLSIEPTAATISIWSAGLSLNAATPTAPLNISESPATTDNSSRICRTPPNRRLLVTTTTTVRLVANVSFSAGSVNLTGRITARRVR